MGATSSTVTTRSERGNYRSPRRSFIKAEKVTLLQQPYKFGDTRAIMIEGPSRESIEILGK
jgi:hypothetical protein